MKVDKQGRLVVPQALREGLVDPPGELLAVPTPDGLLLRSLEEPGVVEIGADGLPLLRLNRPVTNDEVLAGIDAERASR